MAESALQIQEGGGHYKKLKIQPVEYIHANGIPFIEGCVIKYATRWRDKGGVEDLKKARHFLDLLIELESKTAPPSPPEAAANDDGWIEWEGGECPVVAGANVLARFRDGACTTTPMTASSYDWWHFGHYSDIVAYRIAD